MKKKVITFMIGILLIGGNLYAAGDLIVNGKLGAGTSTLNAKINVESTDEPAMNVVGIKSANATWFNGAVVYARGNALSNASILGLSLSATSYTTNATVGGVVGITGISMLSGSGNIGSATGFINSLRLNTTAGNYTIGLVNGQDINLATASSNSGNHTITNYYGIYSRGAHNNGTVGGTNWRHAYFENFPNFGGTVTNVTGLWIDQQTYGTNKYGIVLNGDGAGADIVFGPTQGARIYSDSGYLKAQDIRGNVTTFSPHDPVTGEWIFYSKNINTGKTVRVNMEKLVKAVEKLTGETFMVETLIEDK